LIYSRILSRKFYWGKFHEKKEYRKFKPTFGNPKKIGHVYRECIRPAYNTPIYGAGIMPRKKTGKTQGYRGAP
jgi:hypothetical protein